MLGYVPQKNYSASVSRVSRAISTPGLILSFVTDCVHKWPWLATERVRMLTTRLVDAVECCAGSCCDFRAACAQRALPLKQHRGGWSTASLEAVLDYLTAMQRVLEHGSFMITSAAGGKRLKSQPPVGTRKSRAPEGLAGEISQHADRSFVARCPIQPD